MDQLIVKCTLCEATFSHQDFNEKNAADTCKCGNIRMGIRAVEGHKHPFHVTVSYKKEGPEFFQETKNGQLEKL